MSAVATTDDLSKRVHSLVSAYVYRKTESRCGIKWEDFKDKKITDPATGKTRMDVPQLYRDAREKICANVFLRLRSCKSREDFVEYFTGTICSVPQYLPEEKYQKFVAALLDGEKWVEVKALAMLALSGLSRI
jgi:CRISPR-associated protein Cmx8